MEYRPQRLKLAAIIPCYRVSRHAVRVVTEALERLDHVFVVDDLCPEGTGDLIAANFPGDRVTVLRHSRNKGVGAAMVTGYRAALDAGYDVLVKIDGDGQMDLAYLSALVQPIILAEADYTKGNRFYRRQYLAQMPPARLLGNSALSLLTKASTGYWNLMDPTNGYTALHKMAAREIDWTKIAEGYFFESDILFRLNIARAVVKDVPIPAQYGDEDSNLKISRVIGSFFRGHIRNFIKRFVYNYLIRDFSVGTIQTLGGAVLLLFGLIFGGITWFQNAASNQDTPVGTVMLATLPIILGCQLLLAALSFDVANIPARPLQRILLPPPGRRLSHRPPIDAAKLGRAK